MPVVGLISKVTWRRGESVSVPIGNVLEVAAPVAAAMLSTEGGAGMKYHNSNQIAAIRKRIAAVIFA